MTVFVKFARIHEAAQVPLRATDQASGFDLFMLQDAQIAKFETVKLKTGVCIELPSGYEAQIRPRSGLSSRGVLAIFGTIDSDYRGEISVTLSNIRKSPYLVRKGDRVAQLVVVPVLQVVLQECRVEEFSATARGVKGYGSTGD